MSAPFLTFQQFNDPGLASAIAATLKEQEVECVVEKVRPLLEPGFFRNTIEQNIHLKVRATDLEKAEIALEEHYRRHLQDIDPGYYLFAFTDIELLDILSKPDEWGHFDYVLASELLAQRGLEIPAEIAEKMKRQRRAQLAQQEKLIPPDGLVEFGTTLDRFFSGVSDRLMKIILKISSKKQV
ncbi:MAG TPA: hypothetical protein VNU72_00590 [Puia sp.]|jgi:hypothetical protein|nr:hypothetical protein [Puia sp.]